MNQIRFSIIVVAYNIENFIEECLESCIFMNRDDYEVIVIHNASTDRTLESIRRVTSRSPELFRVIENAENLGLGIGRNQGMEAARGDYIIFLDGDDYFSSNALPRITEVVYQQHPEILFINYARFHQDGRTGRNPVSSILSEGWRNSVNERQRLFRNFGVAWNKVYSKSLIQRHNLSFPPCLYEDIVWNAECIMRAQSIYVIPDCLIYYRQRPGSILRSTDIRHFDTIAQHRRIVDIIAGEPHLAASFGKELRWYSRNQMFATLHIGGRIPRGNESRYLRELSRTLSMYDGVVGHPRWSRREFFARSGSYALYQVYHQFADRWWPKSKARYSRLWRAIKQKCLQQPSRLKHRSFKIWYKYVFLKLPIKSDRVVFDSFWGRRADGNPLALYLALDREQGFDCAYMLRRDAQDIADIQLNRVGRSSFEGYLYLATAKYLITNSAFPDDYVKRPGQVLVQTQHGTPFKYMGLQQRLVQPKAMNWWHLALRARVWDYVVSSNEYSTAVWRKAFPYNYKIIESGYPANDWLCSRNSLKTAKIRESLHIPKSARIALYAPTYRDEHKNKSMPLSDILDVSRLLEALGEEFVLLVRSHYFSEGISASNPRVIDVSEYPITNDILLVTDLLISDYSSVIADFAVLDRPIILYAYDAENYASQRGMYLDIADFAPGVLVDTFDELCASISSRSYDSSSARERLSRFRRRFCSMDDGHATDRVLRNIFGVAQKGYLSEASESPVTGDRATEIIPS